MIGLLFQTVRQQLVLTADETGGTMWMLHNACCKSDLNVKLLIFRFIRFPSIFV